MKHHLEELENRLGFTLPEDYRAFLTSNDGTTFDPLVFRSPKSGIIDHILTAEQILRNDRDGRIGIPKEGLLHIGGNVLGGYLYLCVAENGFGQIIYSEGYAVKEEFDTFSAFINETEKEA